MGVYNRRCKRMKRKLRGDGCVRVWVGVYKKGCRRMNSKLRGDGEWGCEWECTTGDVRG